MKKLKKIVSLFLICIVAIMSLPSVSFAAAVGDILRAPESGWQRIDDTDSKFVYNGTGWGSLSRSAYYGGSRHQSSSSKLDDTVAFKFKGTKLRIIASAYPTFSNDLYISIDGVKESFSEVRSGDIDQIVVYEKLDLSNKVHVVEIGNNTKNASFIFDAIDIDDNGSFVDYDTNIDTSNLLKVVEEVGENIQLSVNDNLDKNTEMKWTSSDSSIATVDEQGVVKGIKPGNTAITVTNADGTYTDTINILVIESEPQLAVDINVGDSRRMTIDDLAGTTNATWTSNDETIATVDNKGKVTAVAVGTTYMTVKDDKGNEVGKIYVRVRN